MVVFQMLAGLLLSPVLSVETNIASQAYITGSSNNFVNGQGFGAMTDYSIESQWHAADFDNSNGESWLQFDFRTAAKTFSRFELTSGRWSNFNARSIQVQGRLQTGAWENIASHSNNACYSGHRKDYIYAYSWAKLKGYTAVKFVLRSKCGGIHFAVSDIKIYGDDWKAPEPEPTDPPTDPPIESEEDAKKKCAETTPDGKKACKKALPEAVGACKWKKKKCVLKQYNLPCEQKGKRKCKKAVKGGRCVFKEGDKSGKCYSK